MNHNFIKKISDEYFRCNVCNKVIKIVREDGRIDYLIDNNSIAGRFSKNEPACLKIIK